MEMKKLSSGLTCYVIPKPGYVEKQAAIAVNYGSADLRYRVDDGPVIETPQGVAHFLEHKLFESEDINVYQAFTRRGASVNAYTNFANTAYYFTTIDSFEENLRLLIKCVQSPYFTDDNVEKEKGIITQEINMYRDDPSWKIYFNLYQALFHQSPVRYDIAGTEETVNGMHKDLLYQCYDTFYTPAQMSLVCVGDVNPACVFEWVEQEIHTGRANKNIERLYGEEPPHAARAYTEEAMPISIPMFQIGYKALYDGTKGEASGKIAAASSLLTDILAGESSPLYADLYRQGFIDNRFSVTYIGGIFFGTSLFTGQSTEPKKVEARLQDEINRLKKEGVSQERFDIIKQKQVGRFLRSLNYIDAIATLQTDLHSKGLSLDQWLDILKNITLDDVEERLHHHLRDEYHALSVVWPQS